MQQGFVIQTNQLFGGNGISMTSYNGSAAVSNLTIDLDGSSLSVGSDGIKISDSGVSNAMLAGSITAAKLAGSIPADKLNLGNGVEESGGNLIVSLDGATLALGAGGLSVAAGGIGATQLASDSVVSAKIADGAIDSAAYIADSLITNAKLAGSIANAKLANSTISFARKVDTEDSYDFLYFMIDGQVQAEWSGNSDWTIEEYEIEEGLHTIEWTYVSNWRNKKSIYYFFNYSKCICIIEFRKKN